MRDPTFSCACGCLPVAHRDCEDSFCYDPKPHRSCDNPDHACWDCNPKSPRKVVAQVQRYRKKKGGAK